MTGATDPSWVADVLEFFKQHSELAALICFVLGFGESIALVSLFVPSTVLFLGIGGAYSAMGGNFLPIWLAGAAGACIGDCVSYFVGRYFKDDVDRIWPFTKMPGLVPKGRAVFERWGALSIVGGKFIGGLRPFIPVVAGVMNMPFAIFIVASAVSSLIWAGAFLAPGYGLTMFWN
jgi:membrane protein DedA with SNARE-associated domain